MQLILVKLSGILRKKYLIQKFHDIRLSYYFKHSPSLHCFLATNNMMTHTTIYNDTTVQMCQVIDYRLHYKPIIRMLEMT